VNTSTPPNRPISFFPSRSVSAFLFVSFFVVHPRRPLKNRLKVRPHPSLLLTPLTPFCRPLLERSRPSFFVSSLVTWTLGKNFLFPPYHVDAPVFSFTDQFSKDLRAFPCVDFVLPRTDSVPLSRFRGLIFFNFLCGCPNSRSFPNPFLTTPLHWIRSRLKGLHFFRTRPFGNSASHLPTPPRHRAPPRTRRHPAQGPAFLRGFTSTPLV